MEERQARQGHSQKMAEMLRLWMDIYEGARREGVPEEEAKAYADTVCPLLKERGLKLNLWMEVHDNAVRSGLPEELAKAYANTVCPLDKDVDAIAAEIDEGAMDGSLTGPIEK